MKRTKIFVSLLLLNNLTAYGISKKITIVGRILISASISLLKNAATKTPQKILKM